MHRSNYWHHFQFLLVLNFPREGKWIMLMSNLDCIILCILCVESNRMNILSSNPYEVNAYLSFSYAVSHMDFFYVVSCRSNPPPAEIQNLCKWTCWGDSGSVFCCNTGVPNGRGVGTCGERKQGSQGEAYHTTPPSAGHSWRWGTWHPYQRHHCRWWCHPSHPQVPH